MFSIEGGKKERDYEKETEKKKAVKFPPNPNTSGALSQNTHPMQFLQNPLTTHPQSAVCF